MRIELQKILNMTLEAENILNTSAKTLGLSARGYHRTQKLARTIADLDASDKIKTEHILEALRYRPQIENF